MSKDQDKQPKLKDFEVETVFEDRPYERHAFTVSIYGNEYKGHFHDEKIHWLHPQPKQILGEIKLEGVEKSIHKLMREQGISSEIEDFEIEKVFENQMHERYQFTLQVFGEEFKGFVHDGEVQWFQPQPMQKLKDKHVLAIESEVQHMVKEYEGGSV
ncbi:hypothetical protein F7731_24445 [Cytobacillus depressus]|uniref:HicA family toxin-antitoxin system n=1 Tax=Cytobacillus depressus TaxID=1602942 RepID=A0A6L3UZY7_9BACI|nr:hypothetical protein [Cytobacillus depressus]KAB2328676.1 hypothetical protein F7731_24445 [Cytobacillus depressus]